MKLWLHNFGFFRLDGGSMFGSVPKEIWQKKIPADEKNRIELATNSLIIENGENFILIDTGNGDKWSDKLKEIYCINHIPLPREEKITDIILTHLHFDHAGGVSRRDGDGAITLTYPDAEILLQKENYSNASKPNLKERASYLKENIEVLDKANLTLIDGSKEIFPGITVHRIDGHTTGQQYIEIKNGDETFLYATDLIPTSHHLPIPYHMGYDVCGLTTMREKQEFLEKALLLDATIVFQHDPLVPAGKVKIDEKGHFALAKTVKLNPW